MFLNRLYHSPLTALVLLAAAAICAQSANAPDIGNQAVLDHLNQTIAWYDHITAAQPSGGVPQNVVLQDNVRQSSMLVVQKAFAFARAQASFLSTITGGAAMAQTGSKNAPDLEQVAQAARVRTERLQNQIADLNNQIAKTKKRKVIATLTSQRDALNAELSFSKLTQSDLKDMLSFASGNEKASGLLGQINLLASSDSVPAALSNAAPATGAPKAATPEAFHAETAGIFGLIANTFSLLRGQSQIDNLLAETSKLHDQVNTLVTPLRAKAKNLMLQSEKLATAASQETDAAKLTSAREQIVHMSAQFKGFTGPFLPLSEQGIAIESTRAALQAWRASIGGQLHTVFGYLAFRLGTLLAIVAVLLVISEVVRRAAFRYVHDTRRRRQIVLIRRFIVATIITLLILLTSVSSLGSFATVAGFVTAGLAVALQNVILSVVAYFFLIGRYGIRTGDRVTVTGVTGQVIEVGLVRFYMMELSGAGNDLHSTGRVAVFSNSVIFQPAALIKQAPGTEYTWHSVSATLADDTGLENARKRIEDAVNSIYKKYRDVIVQQQATFERATNVQLTASGPISRARFTDSGVEIIVRYPVEIQAMSEVDEQIILAVLHETQSQPPIKLAAGGFPKIVTAS